MNHRVFLLLVLAALPAYAARPTADLTPPARRQATVEIAERLTRRVPPPELPADLPSPFNPAGFTDPDPDVLAAQAAQRAATGAAPVGPVTDREILETLAERLTPSGTFRMGDKPFLIIDRNRFEVGTKFIVTYNERDFELQLTSIDRTTFTLRYRGEEITRPIKPVK